MSVLGTNHVVVASQEDMYDIERDEPRSMIIPLCEGTRGIRRNLQFCSL